MAFSNKPGAQLFHWRHRHLYSNERVLVPLLRGSHLELFTYAAPSWPTRVKVHFVEQQPHPDDVSARTRLTTRHHMAEISKCSKRGVKELKQG
jgi:hypothetical protein